ncbi:E2F-associated phosphoprotein [Vigna unguiculata]|uniref:E2F-associated phosphoprotein n=1 Tax=Vigna unguiculata TaxID=3917 RepID=A0A4D6N866_VIGUN|nr:E2F-associated phosphoprotein [Vigna unguiculata]
MDEDDGVRDNTVTHSPTNSQQTVSDDDEIDYTTKPEFYDPDLDDKNEQWIHKKRQGRVSDAVLSCPACFTTLCLECQRHEKYLTQYRAVFVANCKIGNDKVLKQNTSRSRKRNRGSERFDRNDTNSTNGETFKQVCCSVCSTEKWPSLNPTTIQISNSELVYLTISMLYTHEDIIHTRQIFHPRKHILGVTFAGGRNYICG